MRYPSRCCSLPRQASLPPPRKATSPTRRTQSHRTKSGTRFSRRSAATSRKSTGKITLDREAKKGSIDVSIDTTSIRSHDPRLDSILKGEDYFNVAKYPTMTFKSTAMRFDGDRLTGVDGELTMIGVTRPVTLKVTDFQCGENPFNKRAMCGAEVSTTIKRSDWGMKTGVGRSSGDDVKITIPVEAYRE